MSNFVAEFMIVYETMTLRELLQSVDADAYASIPLFEDCEAISIWKYL